MNRYLETALSSSNFLDSDLVYEENFAEKKRAIYIMNWEPPIGDLKQKIVAKATNSRWSHSSYSFNEKLDPFFEIDPNNSYNFSKMTFDKKSELGRDGGIPRTVNVQKIILSESQFKKANSMTRSFLKRRTELKYDSMGIAESFLIPGKRKNKKNIVSLSDLREMDAFICSGIISVILHKVSRKAQKYFRKSPSAVYPKDLERIPFAEDLGDRTLFGYEEVRA